MPGFILGFKDRQTRIFSEAGDSIPVSHIRVPKVYLTGIKTKERDGYYAIRLAISTSKHVKKPVLGELKKAGVDEGANFAREFRLEYLLSLSQDWSVWQEKELLIQIKDKKLKVGDIISPTIFFNKGDFVDVSGISKGKGFQGVVKRHGFAGGPRTHGQSDRERAPGSIGQTTTPGRVFKGKRMAGRMGGERVTVQNLQVIDVTENLIVVKGLIPGAYGSVIEVRPAVKILKRAKV